MKKILLIVNLLPSIVFSQTIDTSFWDRSINQVLDLANHGQPTVSGGSLSFAAATLATSMIIFSVELSRKKVKDSSLKKELAAFSFLLIAHQDSLEELGNADAQIFNAYLQARKLPDSTIALRKIKTQLIQNTLKVAAESPLVGIEIINKILKVCENIYPRCHFSVLSDLGAGILYLRGTVEALNLFVQANSHYLRPEHKERVSNRSKIISAYAIHRALHLQLLLQQNISDHH